MKTKKPSRPSARRKPPSKKLPPYPDPRAPVTPDVAAATRALTEPVTEADLGVRASSETATEREVRVRAERIVKAEALLAAVKSDPTKGRETARLRMHELAPLLGDDVFMRDDVVSLLHLVEDARRMNVSLHGAVEVMKKRVAIYERAMSTARPSEGNWDFASLWPMIAGMGIGSYMASALGKKKG